MINFLQFLSYFKTNHRVEKINGEIKLVIFTTFPILKSLTSFLLMTDK